MADLYKVKDITTGKFLYWTLPQVLGEINRDRSDWREGWFQWVDGNGYFKLRYVIEGEG